VVFFWYSVRCCAFLGVRKSKDSPMLRLYSPPYGADHCTYGFMNGPKDAKVNRLSDCLNITHYPTMSALPPALWELESLGHLSLQKLPALQVFPDMSLMKNIKTLVMQNLQGLTGITAAMASPPQLARLQIKMCLKMKRMDSAFIDAVCERTCFKFFSWGDCPIALNPEMGRLRHLEGMQLHTVCELTRGLFDFSGLGSLSSVHLSDMEFVEELPESLWGVTGLQHLALRNMPLRKISAGIGRLANLETLWLEELTIRCVPLELGMLAKLRELNLQLCIFCRSFPVEALLGLVSLQILLIEWLKCPEDFGEWYVGAGYSQQDTQGVMVFQQLCAALPSMPALETLTLREVQDPLDIEAVAATLRSPAASLRYVYVQSQVLERMAAAMYEEPRWRRLNSENHLRHWRNEQAKVLAFAAGLLSRVGNASCVLSLNRDVVRQVGREVFGWGQVESYGPSVTVM